MSNVFRYLLVCGNDFDFSVGHNGGDGYQPVQQGRQNTQSPGMGASPCAEMDLIYSAHASWLGATGGVY